MRSRVPAQVSIIKCHCTSPRCPAIFYICSREYYLLRNAATSPVRPHLPKPHFRYTADLLSTKHLVTFTTRSIKRAVLALNNEQHEETREQGCYYNVFII